MKSLNRVLLTGIACALLLSACDSSEQNILWDPGDSLAIVGPITAGGAAIDDDAGTAGIQVARPASGSRSVYFYVRGFNSSRTYAWTANNQALPSLQGGEFTELTLSSTSATGPYTVRVHNGQYEGTVSFTVIPAP